MTETQNKNPANIQQMAEKIRKGDRRALARAITQAESIRKDHQESAQALLNDLLPDTGKSVRIGISGTPGVGKSTFIEAFGKFLTGLGKKVAVLTIDPSSKRTGGSILGDKTRMEELSRDPNAFIRPSPSGGSLGGVARRTREVMLLCEAAGFDVILIETVGVGQSETTVADMVDLFMLLLAPAGGDELQGIKRGVMELADIIVINKADGDLIPVARRAASEYRGAVGLMRPKSKNWMPKVMMTSALKKLGIDELWQTIEEYREARGADDELETQRSEQAAAWMWSEIDESLMNHLREHPTVSALLPEKEAAVKAGKVSAAAAARELLAVFLGK
ncbi:methylmalonyl Co-A mutase-associated GTPase MeaB [Sneathiella sp. P13V-1]|uniref:methylmalonyl Co-A mutase-associated GTPase MeaB n=1 Tax=Sneathiella sp. P13V-1 TaxID=2697366 RepID=UPI00187B9AAD|nr:methylmalonyl Co-A mutase-associated GTPase MeaB [Sneathiella sp. P13V-1]MBE7638471.1 methylmalonyl Co-A mutase-associated GTPase MeaB [Sneathiella sp. P13V-1]